MSSKTDKTETRKATADGSGVVESVHVVQTAGASEPEPQVPARQNNEVLPHVAIVAGTITKCTDAEIKNYLATVDFLCRKLAVRMADMWPDICRTAKVNGKENESSAKVSMSYGIKIDHSNLQMHDTKATLAFARKFAETDEIQEDLTQTEFATMAPTQ